MIEELERNLTEKVPNMTPEKAARRIAFMRNHYPDAMVTGYEMLIPHMKCEEKDRHVLAAASMGKAEVIVTANVKGFPDEALKPHNISAKTPDEFLLDQLDLYPEETSQTVVEAVGDRRNPPERISDYLHELGKLVPEFSRKVAEIIPQRLR